MVNARTTNPGALDGAVKAASAAHRLSACTRKRRSQNWPRWCGIGGGSAWLAKVGSRRVSNHNAITAMLERRYGRAHSGNRETVRRQTSHR